MLNTTTTPQDQLWVLYWRPARRARQPLGS
jgi:hypothetical protein